MELTINGQTRAVPEGQTVADLVASMGLENRPVAVEVNAEVVPKRDHAATLLNPGDRVEVVTLVGGG